MAKKQGNTSIYLDDGGTQLIKGVDYEITLQIPSKKDTQAQYLDPVFVVGFMRKPSL